MTGNVIQISIRTPLRGRLLLTGNPISTSNFNPRPHAGATEVPDVGGVLQHDFNPRPHAGAT